MCSGRELQPHLCSHLAVCSVSGVQTAHGVQCSALVLRTQGMGQVSSIQGTAQLTKIFPASRSVL